MATDENWFDTESGGFAFYSPVVAALLPDIQWKKNGVGGDYFSVQKSYLNSLLSVKGGDAVSVSKLDDDHIQKLKDLTKMQRDTAQAASVALSVAGLIADPKSALANAGDAFLAYLGKSIDAEIVSIDKFLDFVTTGGESYTQVAFRPGPEGFKPKFLGTVGYQVQVGEEPSARKWLALAALLPIEVILKEIETKTPGEKVGNKRLESTGDGIWKSWDIDEARYDNKMYEYRGQDPVYSYFSDHPDEDSKKRWRVHMYDGPMERSSDGGGTWATVYPKVETR